MPNSSLQTKKITIFFVLAIIGVLIDQVTKWWFNTTLVPYGAGITVIPDFLSWLITQELHLAF